MDKTLYPRFAGQEGGPICSGATGGAQSAVGFGRGFFLRLADGAIGGVYR